MADMLLVILFGLGCFIAGMFHGQELEQKIVAKIIAVEVGADARIAAIATHVQKFL